jgi:flagellar protein FliL
MADAEPPALGGKKKSSLVGTIIEWLAVTIIAAGAGAALIVMNPQPIAPDKVGADKPAPGKLASEKKEGEKVEVAANCTPGGPSIVDMPPIVTNIANPADTWVRLEASIVFDPKTEPHPEIVAAEIATDELAYLHTVSVNELQGPIGLENLRQDLRDRALVRSNGKVTELLLKTLVLQ